MLTLLPEPALALQVLSALALVSLALCAALTLRGPGAPWFVLCCLILPPALLRAGMVGMSDMLAMALVSAGLLCWVRCRDGGAPALALGFALALGGAVLVRPVCGLLLVLPALDGLRIMIGRGHWGALLAGSAILAGALALLAWDMGWRPQEMLETQHIAQWSPANWTAAEVSTPDGAVHRDIPNLPFALTLLGRPAHWPLLLLLPFARPADAAGVVSLGLLGSALLYLLFVAGAPGQSARHLMPAHLPIALLLWPAWQRARAWLGRWAPPAAAGIGVLLLALFPRAIAPLVEASGFERSVAQALAVQEAPVLYSFALTPALQGRGLAIPIRDLWTPLDRITPGALVLLAPQSLRPQWAGTPVMQNWQRLSTEHALVPIAELGRGWGLWRVGALRP